MLTGISLGDACVAIAGGNGDVPLTLSRCRRRVGVRWAHSTYHHRAVPIQLIARRPYRFLRALSRKERFSLTPLGNIERMPALLPMRSADLKPCETIEFADDAALTAAGFRATVLSPGRRREGRPWGGSLCKGANLVVIGYPDRSNGATNFPRRSVVIPRPARAKG